MITRKSAGRPFRVLSGLVAFCILFSATLRAQEFSGATLTLNSESSFSSMKMTSSCYSENVGFSSMDFVAVGWDTIVGTTGGTLNVTGDAWSSSLFTSDNLLVSTGLVKTGAGTLTLGGRGMIMGGTPPIRLAMPGTSPSDAGGGFNIGGGIGVLSSVSGIPPGQATLIAPTNIVFVGGTAWKASSSTGDWNTAGNWEAGSAPNGAADVAVFNASVTTDVSLSANTEVDGVVFNPGASAYTITVAPAVSLTLGGSGITNNSGIAQNFVAPAGNETGQGLIQFFNSATAGRDTHFTTHGGETVGALNGFTGFFDTSTAGEGAFTTNGGTANGASGGYLAFHDTAFAGNGTFTTNGGTANGASGGVTEFNEITSAGYGTFTNNGGTGGGASGGVVLFHGSATASYGTFTNQGASVAGADGGRTHFHDSSTGGEAFFINNGGTASDAGGGYTIFSHFATVADGRFYSNGGTVHGASGGYVQFWDEATVGGGYFFNYSGKAGGASGGVVEFHDATSAGSATFANDGGVVDGAGGGVTLFSSTSEAGNSTFIAYGGWGGGQGGKILFLDDSTGGTATVQIYYNGSLDISGHNPGGVTIGSLEGTGNLFLGANNLTVGSNNLSTIFSGVIQDGGNSGGILGSLTKTGTGILVLSGANTYTGATTVDAGTLQFAGEGSLYSSNTTNWTAANIVVSGGATLALNVGGAGEFDSADVSAISALGTDAGGFKNGAILGLDTTNVGGNFTYGGTLADPNGGANSLGLSKLGTGTLTLTGNNTYTGGTTINGGTLVAANNDALGTGSVTINAGTLLIQTGTTISNSIVLNGGNLAQTFSAGTSLADAINTTSDPGGMQTVAEILDGTTSSVATLQSSFAGFSLASNDVVRLSDVFSLSGVPVIDGLTGETDTFVLQLQIVDVNADSFLGWLDPATNQWVNAVDGNIGGTPFFAGDHVYDPLADFHLGTYGVDTANNTVWAVINHNSEFAAVPEPGTSALLVLGAVAIFLIVCQKKRIA